MALFTKKAAEEKPRGGGTDVVGAALAAQCKRIGFSDANLARDLGVPVEALRNFAAAAGGAPLASGVMAGLVKILFHGHAEFDLEADLLRSLAKPATVIGAARPAPAVGRSVEEIFAGRMERVGQGWSPIAAPRPKEPPPPVATHAKPGWA